MPMLNRRIFTTHALSKCIFADGTSGSVPQPSLKDACSSTAVVAPSFKEAWAMFEKHVTSIFLAALSSVAGAWFITQDCLHDLKKNIGESMNIPGLLGQAK